MRPVTSRSVFEAKAMASNQVKFDVPLTQGFGYGIILGLGFAFALVMIFITWALKRYVYLEWLMRIALTVQ